MSLGPFETVFLNNDVRPKYTYIHLCTLLYTYIQGLELLTEVSHGPFETIFLNNDVQPKYTYKQFCFAHPICNDAGFFKVL